MWNELSAHRSARSLCAALQSAAALRSRSDMPTSPIARWSQRPIRCRRESPPRSPARIAPTCSILTVSGETAGQAFSGSKSATDDSPNPAEGGPGGARRMAGSAPAFPRNSVSLYIISPARLVFSADSWAPYPQRRADRGKVWS
jgi:hypothetical protein